jgi:hypothetical protein
MKKRKTFNFHLSYVDTVSLVGEVSIIKLVGHSTPEYNNNSFDLVLHLEPIELSYIAENITKAFKMHIDRMMIERNILLSRYKFNAYQ